MNENNNNDYEIYTAQQDRLAELLAEAGKELKLEKPALAKAVADWLYVEGKGFNYFKEAAEKGEGDDLADFLEAATKAWLEWDRQSRHGGPKALTAAEAMAAIISVAYACKERPAP